MIITCQSKSCQNDSTSPLFSNEKISPGDSITKTITIKNERQSLCYPRYEITTSANTDFVKQLTFSSNVSGEIKAKSQKDFEVKVSLPSNLNNSFKNQNMSFDFVLDFRCEDEPQNIFKNTPVASITEEPSVLGAEFNNQSKPTRPIYLYLLIMLFVLIFSFVYFSKKRK